MVIVENQLIREMNHSQSAALSSPEARLNAIGILQQGAIVSFQWGPVFGLLADATQEDAIQRLATLKNEPVKVFSTIKLGPSFRPLVAFESLHPNFKLLFEQYDKKIDDIFGGLAFMRTPLEPTAIEKHKLPSSLVSEMSGRTILHCLLPEGHPLMAQFFTELESAGLKHIAATSMNEKDKPEITDISEAEKFTDVKDISLLLTDPLHRKGVAKGSFAIIDLIAGRIHRAGFIPEIAFHRLAGFTLSSEGMIERRELSSPVNIPEHLLLPTLGPPKIRRNLLDLLHDYDTFASWQIKPA